MGITKKSIALTASTLRRVRCISAGSVFAAAAAAVDAMRTIVSRATFA